MIPDGSLMHSAVNLKLGQREDRSLMCILAIGANLFLLIFILYSTGVHTVADAFCMGCNERIGWFYHKASDFSQKYKEGELVRGYPPMLLTAGNRQIPLGAREAREGERLEVGCF